MTAFRSEETLVGIVALAAVPWIVWMLVRGVRDGRLAIGRGHVALDERPGPFWTLFALYAAAGLLMVWIAIDLLVGIEL